MFSGATRCSTCSWSWSSSDVCAQQVKHHKDSSSSLGCMTKVCIRKDNLYTKQNGEWLNCIGSGGRWTSCSLQVHWQKWQQLPKNTKIAKKRDKNSPKMTMLLREGEEVDITCTVHASPPATVTWMKGQAKLKSSGRWAEEMKNWRKKLKSQIKTKINWRNSGAQKYKIQLGLRFPRKT